MLLQYFEDAFGSFYVEQPLSIYQDLLDRVKKKLYRFFKALTSIAQYHTKIFLCKHGTTVNMSPKLLGTLRLVDQTFTEESV